MEVAGYIIQDKQGTAIFGFGATVDEAWEMVKDGVGTFFDAYGNEKAEDAAYTEDFTTLGATADLLAQVAADGGDIRWGRVRGIACTVEEEELAMI